MRVSLESAGPPDVATAPPPTLEEEERAARSSSSCSSTRAPPPLSLSPNAVVRPLSFFQHPHHKTNPRAFKNTGGGRGGRGRGKDTPPPKHRVMARRRRPGARQLAACAAVLLLAAGSVGAAAAAEGEGIVIKKLERTVRERGEREGGGTTPRPAVAGFLASAPSRARQPS